MPLSESDFQGREPLTVAQYFSENYWEARDKFRWAATALGKKVDVQLHSLLVKDPDYTMDVAVVKGSGSKGLLIHSSGVHGAEGFAGSAIQSALLHGFICSGEIPPVTCVFVHAVNPYGMAHFRRFNENNVDLNRNALTPEGWSEVMARDPNIAGYEDFKSLLLATQRPTKFFAYIGFWLNAIYLLARYGTRHLKRAMVTATYHHPNGIFYGGQEVQPSHAILSKFLGDHFGHVLAAEICWVDVHTGLGPKGVDVLLCSSTDKDKVIKAYADADVQCTDDSNSDGSQAAGYELTRGFIKGGEGSFYQKPFDSSKGAGVILTQEFGTVPGVLVARAMILETRSFICDFANHEYWRQYTRDAFYVRELAWKSSVMSRGKRVFDQTIALISQTGSKL
mmetsp:Transcript_113231/g.178894  ORF Transcript_113231/g.178894 Transcript_113231/m.178894 type:complete len:394 (+) Transcript_113231:55-1236(+)